MTENQVKNLIKEQIKKLEEELYEKINGLRIKIIDLEKIIKNKTMY